MPLTFDSPLMRPWPGSVLPDHLDDAPCPDCERGYSARAEKLFDLWYGKAPFRPADSGSIPFTSDTAVVRAIAERNVGDAPRRRFGVDTWVVEHEAARLAKVFNAAWQYHLGEDDVAALDAANRLREFTHTFVPGQGWVRNEPSTRPTAAELNMSFLESPLHLDHLAAAVVVTARCEREGVLPRLPDLRGLLRGGGVPGSAGRGRGVEADRAADR